jgi:hypothetical protein
MEQVVFRYEGCCAVTYHHHHQQQQQQQNSPFEATAYLEDSARLVYSWPCFYSFLSPRAFTPLSTSHLNLGYLVWL